MFNQKKSESSLKSEQAFGKINMIGNGTRISGEISTDGDIRIDGLLNGTLESATKVVLGESGRIEGSIYCQNMEIYGEIEGNIYVTELVHIKATARIKGDIFAKKLVVEEGAEFNGRCQMGEQNHNLNGQLNGSAPKELIEKKEKELLYQ